MWLEFLVSLRSWPPNLLEAPSLDPVASNETVLRRFLVNHYTHATGSIHAKAFANDIDKSTDQQTDRHSVSREKYTSASQLCSLVEHPEKFGVAAIVVEDYEEMSQEIRHTPTKENRGHSDAIGPKTARVKEHLRKKASVRIVPPQAAGGA